MIVVQCHAERKLFPPAKEDELTFMVCAYRAVSRDSLPDDAKSMDFTATGVMLPLSLIHISEPTRPAPLSRMPSSA